MATITDFDEHADLEQTTEQERARREDQNSNVGFLKLSPELRNRVYCETIPISARISVLGGVAKKSIALLQLCRAIRRETVPIFYGNCLFSFDLKTKRNYERARLWVQGLSPEAIASLRQIYFQSTMICTCEAARTKSACNTFQAWVDVERKGFYSAWGVNSDKCFLKREEALDLVWRISLDAKTQTVRRQDLQDLLEIMRPINAFEFSFEVAKMGAQAAYQSGPFRTVEANLAIRRQIKHPRARRP